MLPWKTAKIMIASGCHMVSTKIKINRYKQILNLRIYLHLGTNKKNPLLVTQIIVHPSDTEIH